MDEKSIKKEFLKYKRQFIRKLGRQATTNLQLNKIALELFGKRYGGSYLQDEKLPIQGWTGYPLDRSIYHPHTCLHI